VQAGAVAPGRPVGPAEPQSAARHPASTSPLSHISNWLLSATSPLSATVLADGGQSGISAGGFVLVQFTFMADPELSMRNEAAPWSDFDAYEYSKANYATVLPGDAQIIRLASSFLIDAYGSRDHASRAVDVGCGSRPNLYPALLMLPWTERIVFTEYASANIDWLDENLADSPGEWAWLGLLGPDR
jgi:hypothetical protein